MLSIQKIKHIIFDFDGVIVDSERRKFSNLQEILKEYNYDLQNSEFLNFIGKKRGAFLKEKKLRDVNQIMEKVHEKDMKFNSFSLVEDIKELLQFLKKKHIFCHIATGSSKLFVNSILKKYELLYYFTHIISGDDIEQSKPNPAVYEEMKKRIACNDLIVIEDSPAGVLAAKRAQLFVIGLGENLNADREFSTIKEFLDFLKNQE